MTEANEPSWVGDVLSFWYDELGKEGWFRSSSEVDEKIVERFGPKHAELCQSLPDRADPRTVLAAVIVLDQFSRNMFRKTPKAFEFDPLAQKLCREAIAAGLDQGMEQNHRYFLYMPLMHSEDLADQNEAVRLFEELGTAQKWAIEHRDMVAKFGRFPHRNQVLGRTNTAAEDEYLKTAATYGQ